MPPFLFVSSTGGAAKWYPDTLGEYEMADLLLNDAPAWKRRGVQYTRVIRKNDYNRWIIYLTWAGNNAYLVSSEDSGGAIGTTNLTWYYMHGVARIDTTLTVLAGTTMY